MKLHNFNLKQDIHFLYSLDSSAGNQGLKSFQWGEFRAKNSEFRIEKSFMLYDYEKPECPPLQVFVSMRKSKEAGVHLTFYVKNVIVNNTDQRLLIYYSS